MQRFQREMQALNAYVTILKKYNTQRAKLLEHKIIILALMPYLENIALTGQCYREAVDELADLFSEEEWDTCIPVIREYFTFWSSDIHAVVTMCKDGDFQSSSTEWLPETIESINLILDVLGEQALNETEQHLLHSYHGALPNRSHDKFFIHTHMRMARYLLVEMRAIKQKNSLEFRQVVDEILLTLTSAGEKKIFLTVARQMYYIWNDTRVLQAA